MRNTTKLKSILYKYSAQFDMDDDGLMRITLIDKQSFKAVEYEATNYSSLISKAYSHLLRELKTSS